MPEETTTDLLAQQRAAADACALLDHFQRLIANDTRSVHSLAMNSDTAAALAIKFPRAKPASWDGDTSLLGGVSIQIREWVPTGTAIPVYPQFASYE